MPRRFVQFQIARDTALCVLAAGALMWAVVTGHRVPSASPMKINGAYELSGNGVGVVSGKAVVTPKKVMIDGEMLDVAGNKLKFTADLTIDGSTYRFKGYGTLDGSTAVVSGRLDPDDKTLKKCRIIATLLSSDGKAGRITGQRK